MDEYDLVISSPSKLGSFRVGQLCPSSASRPLSPVVYEGIRIEDLYAGSICTPKAAMEVARTGFSLR